MASFVILDGEFPRSLAFSVERMTQALAQVDAPLVASASCTALQGLQRMLADGTAETIFAQGLHEFLAGFLRGIAAFDAALQSDYFQSYMGTAECAT